MNTFTKTYLKYIFLVISLMTTNVDAKKKITIKMATLAPQGTEWHSMLVGMGQEWKKATNGEVRLRIYPGGVVGDERDMIRKMRIGQIHAGAITTEGLSEINPYFSIFYVPVFYQSYDDVDFVRNELELDLYEKTEENGFKLLTMVDVGWAYWFSVDPIYTPTDLEKNKIFSWAGDYKSAQLYKKLNYNQVPMAMTDVLSGMQTGLITCIGLNPMYVLSQQVFGIADNMLNMKWGNLTGGIVVDLKTWNRIDKDNQDKMLAIAKELGDSFQKKNRFEMNKPIEIMKEYGLKVNNPTEEQLQTWKDLVEEMLPYFKGSLLDEPVYDRFIQIKNKMEVR